MSDLSPVYLGCFVNWRHTQTKHMNRLLFAGLLMMVISCQQPNTITPAARPVYDTAYQPAKFTDPDRLERISRTFPLIDSLYKAVAEKNHFPGMAYGIVVDGKLVHTGNYGYTDLDKKTPVSTASVFRIASMSKSFTAMAILKLRDAGKLRLDDAAAQYIPELSKQKYLTLDAPVITIRHLLTHGAGFPEDNPWGDRQLADTDKELMEFLQKSVSISTSAGTEYEYSNLGFALLGKIVTVVSGMPYQQYISENIFKPLGMSSAVYEYGEVPADKLAHGYRWLNEQWNEETLLHDTPDGSWGAMGSMLTSIDDFARYLSFHLAAWPPSNLPDDGPVYRSSVREMQFPWRFNGFDANFTYPTGRKCAIASAYAYGLGWMKDCAGRTYIGHSGGLPGFGSQWRIMPDYGIGVVCFANRTYAGVGGINLQVLDTIVQMAGLTPRQLPPSRILEQRKNELMQLLPDWKDAEKSELFAENFFPDNPIDSLRKEARMLFAKAGAIQKVHPMNAINQLRGSFELEGEHQNIGIYFTLSPENPARIQQYRIWGIPKDKK